MKHLNVCGFFAVDTMNNETAGKVTLPEHIEVQRLSSLVQAEFGALTHPGRVRPNNEDHYLIMRLGRDQETLLTNLTAGKVTQSFREWGYVMCVADGLGGEAKGELASSLALSAAVQLVLRFGKWNLRIDDETAKEVMERAKLLYARVSEVVAQRAESDPWTQRMATTLTTAFSAGNELFVAHVGDSRAYLLRNWQLHRLTHDQTYAQLLADAGQISQAEVDTHHMRHILVEAIGIGEGKLDVQVKRLQLDDRDGLLLCSDGLTNMVEEEQILDILNDNANPQKACAALVNAALENGGRDNITVLFARYSIPT